MSGRIRTIKPELLEDDRTAGMSHEAFRLWVALIVMADDYGNLRANPEQLRGVVFWARESLASVSELLAQLSERGSVALYEVSEQQYVHICGWEKHQKVDHPSKARVPSQKEGKTIDPRDTLASPRESLAPRARAQDLRPHTSEEDPEGECEGKPSQPPDPKSPNSDPPAKRPTDPEPEARKDLKPDRTSKSRAKNPRGNHRLPVDWQPAKVTCAYALAHGRDVGACTEDMRNWAEGKGAVRADWDATLRGWVRRDEQDGKNVAPEPELPRDDIPDMQAECCKDDPPGTVYEFPAMVMPPDIAAGLDEIVRLKVSRR